MKLYRFSMPLLAVPVALFALAATPEKAQAGHYISSHGPTYVTPHHTYAPAPQVYYPTHHGYYAPPVVHHYPRSSRSFGFSFGSSHHGGHGYIGHGSHGVHHGRRIHSIRRSHRRHSSHRSHRSHH